MLLPPHVTPAAAPIIAIDEIRLMSAGETPPLTLTLRMQTEHSYSYP